MVRSCVIRWAGSIWLSDPLILLPQRPYFPRIQMIGQSRGWPVVMGGGFWKVLATHIGVTFFGL
jgi:hypothetical protein